MRSWTLYNEIFLTPRASGQFWSICKKRVDLICLICNGGDILISSALASGVLLGLMF